MVKWCLVGLFFWVSNAFAEPLLSKVVQLQYIPASKVIELVQPLMQEGERISGVEHTLVLKVTPHTLDELRALIHQIDKPPVLFRVTIYQGSPDWLNTQNQKELIYSSASVAQNPQSQSVTVLNGESAWVSTGKNIPQVRAVGFGFNAGVVFEPHQVQTGLFVRPVLMGSKVQLSVKRLREQVALTGWQQFDEQHIDTTVMVPLNQWVSIGSSEGLLQPNSSSTVYSAGRAFSQNSSLYLKISLSN